MVHAFSIFPLAGTRSSNDAFKFEFELDMVTQSFSSTSKGCLSNIYWFDDVLDYVRLIDLLFTATGNNDRNNPIMYHIQFDPISLFCIQCNTYPIEIVNNNSAIKNDYTIHTYNDDIEE